MLRKLHLRIYGSVHGVGFRDHIQSAALERGLSGWVRNRSDDSVEIEAIGAITPLEDFFEEVRQGSPNSLIAEIKDTWSEYSDTLSGDFLITPTK